MSLRLDRAAGKLARSTGNNRFLVRGRQRLSIGNLSYMASELQVVRKWLYDLIALDSRLTSLQKALKSVKE